MSASSAKPNVQVVTLETLRPATGLGPDHFAEQYPGCFLLALGLVAAKERDTEAGDDVEQRRKTREWEVVDDTLTLDFGERLTHGMDAHPLAGQAFFLRDVPDERTLIAGRLPSCDVVVPDSSVSERHCGVRVLGGDRLVVTDLNSTNGTWTGQSPLMPGMPRQLLDEQILTVGRYSFQFFSAAAMYQALQLLDAL